MTDKISIPFDQRRTMRPVKNRLIKHAEDSGYTEISDFIDKLFSQIKTYQDLVIKLENKNKDDRAAVVKGIQELQRVYKGDHDVLQKVIDDINKMT